MYMYTYVYIYIYRYIHIDMHSYMLCVYIHTCVNVLIVRYTYIHIYIYIHNDYWHIIPPSIAVSGRATTGARGRRRATPPLQTRASLRIIDYNTI